MKKLLMLIVFFVAQDALSQTIVKFSIDNGGYNVSNSEAQILATIGEVAVAERSVADILYSEGFINSEKATSLSISEFAFGNIAVYPNPMTNTLFISGNTEGLTSVELFSLVGQKIMHIETHFETIDMQQLEAAIYILRLNTEDASKTFKIIKQ